MKKRITAILVTILLVIGMLPTAAFAADYSDINGHWAKAEITKWSNLAILEGSDGLFRPDAPITRGEMAVILDRIMKYQVKADNSFSDLGQAFYTDAILKANASGVIKGDGNTVRPNDKITREEAAVMLGRALGAGKISTREVKFTDAQDISSWAIGNVYAMHTKGYISGFDGKFNPKANITRSEVVKILDNAIKGFYNKAGTYTDDVAGSAVVNTPDVVLKDITIKGDLIITEGVSDGEVTLDNVKVIGSTINRSGNNSENENSSDLSMLIGSNNKYTKVSFNFENKKINTKMLDYIPAKYNFDGSIIKGNDIKEGYTSMGDFADGENAILFYKDTYFDRSKNSFFDGEKMKNIEIPDSYNGFLSYIYDGSDNLTFLACKDNNTHYGLLKYNISTNEYSYKDLYDENGELISFAGPDPYALTYEDKFIYSNNSRIYEITKEKVTTLYDYKRYNNDINWDIASDKIEHLGHTVPLNSIGIKDDMLVIGSYLQKEKGLLTVYLYDYPEMSLTKIIDFQDDKIYVYDSDLNLLFKSENNIILPQFVHKILFMTE